MLGRIARQTLKTIVRKIRDYRNNRLTREREPVSSIPKGIAGYFFPVLYMGLTAGAIMSAYLN